VDQDDASPIFAKEADLVAAAIAPGRIDELSAELMTLKSRLSADAILVGRLDWETNEPGWHATWRLPLSAKDASWAIAAGVTEKLWEIADIVALIEAKEAEKPVVRGPYKKVREAK